VLIAFGTNRLVQMIYDAAATHLECHKKRGKPSLAAAFSSCEEKSSPV
jgi:hypothetical protein